MPNSNDRTSIIFMILIVIVLIILLVINQIFFVSSTPKLKPFDPTTDICDGEITSLGFTYSTDMTSAYTMSDGLNQSTLCEKNNENYNCIGCLGGWHKKTVSDLNCSVLTVSILKNQGYCGIEVSTSLIACYEKRTDTSELVDIALQKGCIHLE